MQIHYHLLQQSILIKVQFYQQNNSQKINNLMKKSNNQHLNTHYESYQTQRLKSKSSNISFQQQKPFSSRYRTQYNNDSYLELAISKTKSYFGKGYLQMKNQNHQNAIQQQMKKKGNMRKVFAFKNLNQFQKSIETQKKLISNTNDVSLKGFGIATFKGIDKTINSHQVSVHISSTNIFTLFQGYDGILSAVTLKKKFLHHFLQIYRKRRSSYREESFKVLQQSIKKAINTSQQQLNKIQHQLGDNSGSSLLSVIVHNGIVFAANCGQSAILCCTINNKIVQLAVPHTTNNQRQVERIIKSGGRLYQTVINIPYKFNMNIKGPLRVAPTGLKYTRTLGKSVLTNQEIKNDKKSKNQILRVPQIQYLPESQIRWLAVLSSKLYDSLNKQRIKDIIEQQLMKRTNIYGNNDASQHICKRLLLQGVQQGIQESATAIILIFNNIPNEQVNQISKDKKSESKMFSQAKKSVQQIQKKSFIVSAQRSLLMPEKKQKSLKYIGNRKNFVQQLHPHSYYC